VYVYIYTDKTNVGSLFNIRTVFDVFMRTGRHNITVHIYIYVHTIRSCVSRAHCGRNILTFGFNEEKTENCRRNIDSGRGRKLANAAPRHITMVVEISDLYTATRSPVYIYIYIYFTVITYINVRFFRLRSPVNDSSGS